MEKLKNIGLSLITSISNEVIDDEANDGKNIPVDLSPTTKKFLSKFDLEADEWVIANYSWALSK